MYKLERPPEFVKKPLMHMIVDSPYQASLLFSQIRQDGIPVTCTCKNKHCYTFKMDIPSSITVVGQKFGRHVGIMPAGAICCNTYATQFPYIITKNTITYKSPVINIPTKDNVRINIDIDLMFRILDDEESVKKFVYKMGAARLDDFLLIEVDEAIRTFIRSVNHDKVLDLKSELATQMIEGLNGKFKSFGVFFENVSISSLKVPYIIERSLADATKYDIQLQSQQKKHENDLISVDNESALLLHKQRHKNKCTVQEMKGKRDVALLERETRIVEAKTLLDVVMVEADKKECLMKINTDNCKQVAELSANKRSVQTVCQATSEAESKTIAINSQMSISQKVADTDYYCAIKKTQCLNEMALSEKNCSENLKVKREFGYELAQISALECIAKNGKIVIGGDNGEELLKEISQAINK